MGKEADGVAGPRVNLKEAHTRSMISMEGKGDCGRGRPNFRAKSFRWGFLWEKWGLP